MISSLSSSISMVTISGLGVTISDTLMSENSSVSCSRSDFSLSITPSSSICSMMVVSSSTVILSSSSFFHLAEKTPTTATTILMTGDRRIISALTGREANSANSKGIFLAMILGLISPKIRITTVMKRVAGRVAFSPTKPMTITVEMEVAAMFTRLLPIRMVDRVLSKFSTMYTARRAGKLPSSALFFSLLCLTEEKAISGAEKKAENTMHTTMPI